MRKSTGFWNETGATLAGVALMYLFDPERGDKRRAVVRDKALHLAGEVRNLADRAQARFLRRRVRTALWRRPAARWAVGSVAALGLAAYGWNRVR